MSSARKYTAGAVAPMTVELFNGPVEMGLRALVVLVEVYPEALDLQRLVTFDYFLVHSGDIVDGPPSLHPPSPLRGGEVSIRRRLLERGLNLYRICGLIEQVHSNTGIDYLAADSAASFLEAFRATYVQELRTRARWLEAAVGSRTDEELLAIVADTRGRWRAEFATLTSYEDA